MNTTTGFQWCPRCERLESLRRWDLQRLASAANGKPEPARHYDDNFRPESEVFVSFTHTDLKHAEKIHQILQRNGFRVAELLAADRGAGTNVIGSVMQALESADRVVMILSPRYFQSEWANAEWQGFWHEDKQGDKRLLVAFAIEPVELPRIIAGLHVTKLYGKEGSAYEDAVLDAAASATGKPPRKARPAASASESRPATKSEKTSDDEQPSQNGDRWIAALVALLLTVFTFTFQDVRDQAVKWTFALIRKDFSLPTVAWTWFGGEWREHTPVADVSSPLNHWQAPDGGSAPSHLSGQWIDLRSLSLLRSTTAQEAPAVEGVAQYRLGFERGDVTLITHSIRQGREYLAVRLHYVRPGQIRIDVFHHTPKGDLPIRHSRKNLVRVGQTLHELAIAFRDESFTLWRNGEIITTWTRDDPPAGAVGVIAGSSNEIRMYRWCLNASPETWNMGALRKRGPAIFALAANPLTPPPRDPEPAPTLPSSLPY